MLVGSRAASGAAKRRHFEPDDLQLEQPGVLDFDFQTGPVHGESASGNHVVLPDFEIGFGLTRNVELDLSGAFTLDHVNGRRHLSGDALWIGTKLGLFDARDGAGNAWALGIELGPRFPTIDAAGVGYGALLLLGLTWHRTSLVVNAGTLIDPGSSLAAGRISSLVVGIDLNRSLDPRGVWSLQSELGLARYWSSDPTELAFTLGTTYAVSSRLDVSLTALHGFLPNTDRNALLFGVSPQLALW